uniref:Uncharacterized protein n=1 Tax=Aplanochytrium stocchinoi TaxID=215587 RepID=A0A7S3PKC0_9STRA
MSCEIFYQRTIETVFAPQFIWLEHHDTMELKFLAVAIALLSLWATQGLAPVSDSDVLSEISCPGSESFIHASCKYVVQVNDNCKNVKEEMFLRVNGQKTKKWHDAHNNGVYTVLEGDEGSSTVLMKRRTGNDKYTDKVLFTFQETSDNECVLKMCSESQVFSVGDFSTNFCNMYLMFCGKSDGCPYVKHSFTYKELAVKPSIGASM